MCISTEETLQRCTIILQAKFIHENSLQLNTSLNNLLNISINFRDLSDVKNSIQEQNIIYQNLQNLSQQINELVTKGNELLKQPMVPKYVQQDIQNIQKVYNEKIQSADDLLAKLKVDLKRERKKKEF